MLFTLSLLFIPRGGTINLNTLPRSGLRVSRQLHEADMVYIRAKLFVHGCFVIVRSATAAAAAHYRYRRVKFVCTTQYPSHGLKGDAYE